MAPGSSSKQRDYDYLFKLVLIGDSGVGKSCLLLRFAVRGVIVRKRVRKRGAADSRVGRPTVADARDV